MRHLFILIAAAGIMLLGFVATLTMLGDEARLKQLLITHMELQTGRTLSIDGHVSVRLFPRIRIDAHDIRLSGPEGFSGPELLRSERASAEIRLLPLIRGRVETREVALQGARLNLLVDDTGLHTSAGLMRRTGREGAPGIMSSGPLRLEDIEIQIGSLAFGDSQVLVVDRIELDGLAFDRALELQFQGAIGRPAMIEDVHISGLLFVPAGTGHFRLADMRLDGRLAGADQPFELLGGLSFSALTPLSMKLDEGRLKLNGHELAVGALYESRARPYVSVGLSGGSLDATALAPGLGAGWRDAALPQLAGWVAGNDFDFRFEADALNVGGLALLNPRLSATARDGAAQIQHAEAILPGAVMELDGDIRVDGSASTVRGVARIEVDDLGELLASADVGLAAEGVGQIVLHAGSRQDSDALAEAELAFFDGQLAGLRQIRTLAGMTPSERFDELEGRLLFYSDRVVFPWLAVRNEEALIRFEGVALRGSQLLSGGAEVILATGQSMRFELAGHSHAPQFLAVPGDAAAQ